MTNIKKDLIGLLIFFLLLGGVVAVSIYMLEYMPYPPEDKEVCGFSSQVQYEHFKRLHSFHGTLSSWTENGTCVYKRDGQICSLWDPLVRTDR